MAALVKAIEAIAAKSELDAETRRLVDDVVARARWPPLRKQQDGGGPPDGRRDAPRRSSSFAARGQREAISRRLGVITRSMRALPLRHW